MNKKIVVAIIAVIILIILLGAYFTRSDYEKDQINFLQNEDRIVISLPYSAEDEAIGMVPVGETVYHPAGGHPGIDFGWNKKTAVRASADGIIFSLPPSGKDNGEIGLVLKSGKYLFEYGSLGEYEKNIEVGVAVKKGDILGYPLPKDGQDYAIHWEIKPAYEYAERLCPLTYLDADSKARLETLWTKTEWEYKSQFPDICNGKWKNLNSFEDILRWIDSPEKIEQDKQLGEYKKGIKAD